MRLVTHYLYISPTLRATAVAIALLCGLGGCEKKAPGKAPSEETPQKVRRIVTLTPSSTEIVAAAGGAKLIVGVDKFSSYPPEVRDLPEVGDFLEPNFEAILRLEPDLVVLDSVQGKAASRLEAAGIHTVVLRMHTIEDVRAGLERVGDALGERDVAQAAVDQLDAAIARAHALTATRRGQRRPAVLAVVEREAGGLGGMVAAGPGSFLDELLAIVDARNIMASSGLRYSNISAEQLLRGKPDVILDASHGAEGPQSLEDWAPLSSVPAVQNGRVHAITESFYTSPGPRVGQALLGLERLIYGSGQEN